MTADVEVLGAGHDVSDAAVGTTPASVVPAGASAHAEAPVDPTRRGSPLGSLRERRKAAEASLYVDIKVPRWREMVGVDVYVRCGPVSPAFLADSSERRQKPKGGRSKDPEWSTLANADVLIHSCLGVFAIEEEDVRVADATRDQMLSLRDGDPTGEWTKFDQDLAYTLSLDDGDGNPSAVRVVRKLFWTDADLITAVNRLAAWSGLKNPQADEDFSEG